MSTKNSTKNNTAKNTEKKVLPIGRKLSESDIAALEARLAAAEAALATEKAAKAALEAKVKTSAKRDVKAPDSYDIIQPLFVTLRGNIGKGIVKDTVLIDIFLDTANKLSIIITEEISKRLFLKTVQHNSTSNIAKADSIKSAEGRKAAYMEMTEQAKVILSLPDKKFWQDCLTEYDIAYNAAVSKLKK